MQDGCPDCQDHAENPFASLDAEMLSQLVTLTLDMRMHNPNTRWPRSENEAIARANVMNALEHAGKIMEVTFLTGDLDRVKEYYNQCWRIPLA